jgi:hypothetical protein
MTISYPLEISKHVFHTEINTGRILWYFENVCLKYGISSVYGSIRDPARRDEIPVQYVSYHSRGRGRYEYSVRVSVRVVPRRRYM